VCHLSDVVRVVVLIGANVALINAVLAEWPIGNVTVKTAGIYQSNVPNSGPGDSFVLLPTNSVTVRAAKTSNAPRPPVREANSMDRGAASAISLVSHGDSSLQRHPDGTTTMTRKDGTVIDVWTDGTIVTSHFNGATEVCRPNGQTDIYGQE